MKAVLMSIQPKWCKLIASGKKTVEVRKTKPKLDVPFKVYIYCTKPNTGSTEDRFYIYLPPHDTPKQVNGTVIGEFVCDFVDEYKYDYCPHPEIGMDYDCGDNWWEIADEDLENACLTYDEFKKYVWGYREVYGWHITDLVIYDKPREFGEFYTQCREYCKTGTIETPKKCYKCRYQYTWHLASKCRVDGKCPIKRPPQSWIYCEEVMRDGT
jgi:hypothetical protein